MKRLPKEESIHHLPSLVLYRQELEEIVRILNPDNKPMFFQSEGYEFESLDEIRKELGPHVRNLKIETAGGFSRPAFTVEDDYTWILNPGPSRVASELRDYLLTKRRLFTLGGAGMRTLIAAMLIFALPFVGRAVFPREPAKIVGQIAGSLAMVFLFFKGSRAWLPGKTIIRLDRRHEHQTFWKRHEENLIRGLIGLVSAIAGGLVVYWFTH